MAEEQMVLSSFFAQEINHKVYDNDVFNDFMFLIDELNDRLNHFKIPSTVDCVYNSTIYARQTFEMYVRKYCNNKKKIMYFGMNPGPWGMSQTGVPFGEVNAVKNWLCIEGTVGKPEKELKARPVQGFDCTRSEISGKRFWGLWQSVCGSPDHFFNTSFVYNYLPQQWMKANGCNLTPGDFKVSDMKALYNICDPIFVKVLQLYEVKTVVAVGKFCETRAKKALEKYAPTLDVQVLYLPHPSPRTVNNNNWEEKALQFLNKYDLISLYQNQNVSPPKT